MALGHILPVKLLVGTLEPAQGRFVLAVEAIVEIDDGVIGLHVLVRCVLQIPKHKTRCSYESCLLIVESKCDFPMAEAVVT
jgi:hypothetical protein